jgi:Single-strand binding protein family
MSLPPRLRQSCREGSSSAGAASALRQQDPRPALNRLSLSGVLAADPLEDKGRDGDPVTLLLIAFPAPDARDAGEWSETASCEVEVPARVSQKHGKELRTGGSVFVSGQLSGGGGVIATEVRSGPPPARPD